MRWEGWRHADGDIKRRRRIVTGEPQLFLIRLMEGNTSFEPLQYTSYRTPVADKSSRERREVIIENPLPYIMLMSAKLPPH